MIFSCDRLVGLEFPENDILNSAVEAVVDRIGPERHELSKRAKDLGYAAAFISMITAAVVGG